MATFFECYLANNPNANDEIVSALSAAVLDLIAGGPAVETLAGAVDGINDTFTLSQVPNPLSSFTLSLISGGTYTTLASPADYSAVVLAGVFTVQLAVPPLGGTTLQGVYYSL